MENIKQPEYMHSLFVKNMIDNIDSYDHFLLILEMSKGKVTNRI